MTKRIIITIRVILIVGISIYFLDSFLEHKNKQQQPVQKKTKEIDYGYMIKSPKNYVGHSIEAEGLVDDSKYINGKGVYSVIY